MRAPAPSGSLSGSTFLDTLEERGARRGACLPVRAAASLRLAGGVYGGLEGLAEPTYTKAASEAPRAILGRCRGLASI